MSGPSSLFPCAKSEEVVQPPQQTVSWLQNSSFPQHLVAAANQIEPSSSANRAGSAARHDSKRIRREGTSDHHKKKKKKEKKKEKGKHKSGKITLETDLFQLLYKGDKDNYSYGSLYSYDVPNYKSAIKCCLGAPPGFQHIMRKADKPRTVTHEAGVGRYYSRLPPVQMTLQYRSKFLDIGADYISLTVSSQCWEQAVREVEVLDPTKSNPKSPEAWIQFINSTGTTRAELERRFSICNEARKHLPRNTEILKRTIHTAQKFMSNQQIGRVWTDMLFHNPHKVDLWLEYLRYKETNLTELNFITVVAAYKKCFSTLLGFQQGTFRSHTFVGDIEDALIRIAAKFISFLYDMGYTEKALSYHTALLELATSACTKEEYLREWSKGCPLLGSVNYRGWRGWDVSRDVTELEPITKVDKDENVWLAWLREERRKEDLSSGPIFRDTKEGAIDWECCVSSAWLKQFLFCSQKPGLLVETLFRTYLPRHLSHLPLPALFQCNINISDKNLLFLMRTMEQLYARYRDHVTCTSLQLSAADQTSMGVISILLHNISHPESGKKTAGFIKGLLKDPAHRNNIVYWALFTGLTDNNAVLRKLLSSPLSSYHLLVLENRLTDRPPNQGTDKVAQFLIWDQQIEQLLCKSLVSTNETLHLGSEVTNMFCKCYRARLSAGQLPDDYLIQYIAKVLDHSSLQVPGIQEPSPQQLADLFVLFDRVLSYELRHGGSSTGSRLKKISLLAVEQFPSVERYWSLLASHAALTSKLWDRLLKVGDEVLWYRRISVECKKQEDNEDINLTNRILSLSISALDIFPRSKLLWGQYLQNTKMYDSKSLKSVLIRSIKENPSYKVFYLEAIAVCPEEAESLYELIEEKQVRLRTLIEEVYMFTLAL